MSSRCSLGASLLLVASCSLTSLDDLQGAGAHDSGSPGGSSGASGTSGTSGTSGAWGTGGAGASSGGTAGAGGSAGQSGSSSSDGSAGLGGGPQMVTLDAVSSSFTQSSGAINLNWSHSVGAGPDRLLLVVVHTYSSVNVSAVTFGGMPVGFVGSSPAAGAIDPRLHFYTLLAPPTGTLNVSVMVDIPVDAEEAIAAALSFHHVDQTAPLGAFSSALGDSQTGPPVLEVASTSGELVVGAVTHRNNTIPLSAASGQSELYNSQGASLYDLWGAAATAPGATKVVLTWSHPDGIHWAMGGVSIRPPLP